MLAKRPESNSQTNLISNSYFKNYKNIMENPNIYGK
jgi:hypothetical protein